MTSRRPPDLPDFERPPVTEVVLSIQFATLQQLRNAHVGAFWASVRKKYPTVSEQPILNPVFETFGPKRPAVQQLQIEALLSPPLHRYWIEEDGGRDMLQLQGDRIIHNWRKRQAEQEYPHYESIRDQFAMEVADFESFLHDEKLGEIKPNQCEVTYINTIQLPDGADPHIHLDKITPLWAGKTTEPIRGDAEMFMVQARYVLREDDKPYARMYIVFSPHLLATDGTPCTRLDITVRGKPQDETVASAFAFMDKGRAAIVKTFAAITTKEMHGYWGRKQ